MKKGRKERKKKVGGLEDCQPMLAEPTVDA